MDEIQNTNSEKAANQKADRIQLIKEQFKSMEERYHTWMNYFSLFNGALLVAYCTIIVSTGKIVETQCNAVKTVYNLCCGYWGLLILITCLGVIASYCWYLSILGHNNWLNNWRRKLQKEFPNPMKEISIDPLLKSEFKNGIKGKVLPGFYSTVEITKLFILSVLTAWNLVFIYAVSKYNHWNLHECCIVTIAIVMTLLLYFMAKYVLYRLLGSNLSNFEFSSDDEENQSKQ